MKFITFQFPPDLLPQFFIAWLILVLAATIKGTGVVLLIVGKRRTENCYSDIKVHRFWRTYLLWKLQWHLRRHLQSIFLSEIVVLLLLRCHTRDLLRYKQSIDWLLSLVVLPIGDFYTMGPKGRHPHARPKWVRSWSDKHIDIRLWICIAGNIVAPHSVAIQYHIWSEDVWILFLEAFYLQEEQ